MKLKYLIPVSIVGGFVLTIISFMLAVLVFSADDSIFFRILLWNFTLAGWLAEKGWLGMCFNCELISVFFIFVDSFIVGLVGYSIIIFVDLWLFNKLRNKNLPSLK